MNNRNEDKSGWLNFLSGALTLPTWLLVLIIIGAVLASLLGATIPASVWILIVLLLLLIGLFIRQAELRPKQRVELSDEDSKDHNFSLSNVPENVTATLLKIESRSKLREFEKDREIGLIVSIAGDLAFYSKDNNNLAVHSFGAPVRLTLNYTDEDEKGLEQRQAFIDKNPQLIGPGEDRKVKLIPIYLYTSRAEGRADINIWKPFQNYTLNERNKTVTVDFLFWGDSPTGWGTKP